jgi:LDH2 family malate/lactate/ureidoglycolate dehydrogenase
MTAAPIDAQKLISACAAILHCQDVPQADAQFVALTLVEADLRGIHSHGVLRLPRYVRELRTQVTNPRPQIRVLEQGPSFARIDGDGGLGPLVGRYALELGMAKARQTGSATLVACRSRHFGAAGYYSLMAAEAGLIGLTMTVASPRLAPTGGTRPLLGNNPLALAVPGDQDFPLLIDFAMGLTGAGRLELAAAQKESIPEGLARDLDGRPTTDPQVALQGSIVPIGEHKGYGLTLLIEILAGLLSGAPYLGVERSQVDQHMRDRGIGHFFLVIDPGRFMPLAAFKAAIATMVQQIKASPRSPGVEEILVPGELEHRRRAQRLASGIPLADSTLEQLRELARQCGQEL